MSKQFISKQFPIISNHLPIISSLPQHVPVILNYPYPQPILRHPKPKVDFIEGERVCQIPKVLISVAPVRFWRFRIPLGP